VQIPNNDISNTGHVRPDTKLFVMKLLAHPLPPELLKYAKPIPVEMMEEERFTNYTPEVVY